MASSKKVAELAGVSISTVSRVFSNPKLVNAKTREKILKIAEEINYVPNINARALKLNKSNIIGVIVSDISNPFYLHILQDVMSYSHFMENNYRFYITFANEYEELEMASIKSLVSSKVDYVIFTPVAYKNKDIESFLNSNRLPTLQLYRRAYDSMDSLTIDDEYGTYLATKELLENNHRNILLIDFNVPTPTKRDIGYIRAFKEKNIVHDPSLIKKIDFHSNIDKEITNILQNNHYSAIIPCSQTIINSVLNYLRIKKIRIKDDISIILYDDSEIAQILDISVVTHPISKIAKNFNSLFLKRIETPNLSPQHVSIQPHLILRNSIKKI